VAQAALSEHPALRLTRRFPASREAVFAALTGPEAMKRWFGPEGIETPVVEVDLRPGGAYRIEFHDPDGMVAVVSGVYREITPPERLIYTWIWEKSDMAAGDTETLVTIELHDTGDGTELTLLHEGIADPEQRARHDQGWNSSFNCLEAFLQQS